MKLAACISTLSILLAAVSFAYPNVGDKVRWEGSINLVDGSTTPIKIVKEVLKHDPETKKWTVKYETTLGHDVSSEISEVDELFSPDKFKELIAHCTANGGTLQTFKAPAGTYETCKTTTVNSEGVTVEKWWGNIPFGIVSKATKDSRNIKTKKPDVRSVIADL